jgi:ribosomal protein S1
MTEPRPNAPEPAWQEFLTWQCGRTPIDGTVRTVLPFGAFVELPGGVQGLLHVSQWRDEPQVGRPLAVRILRLDLDRRQVSLVLA